MRLNRNIRTKRTFHFTSLGCARNLVDSEVMMGILLKAGYEITGEASEADYLVVNTCGFLEASRQEGIDVIGELFEEKKKSAKVIVVGCMVNKHKGELEAHFPDVHYYLGSGNVEKILEAVKSGEGGEDVSAQSYLEWGEVPRTLSTPRHYAYLKIAEGCKKRCAFCIIPAIKGPLKSKTDEQVVKECRSLLAQGIHEINLIAQDLGDYGKDRQEKGALARLVRQILQIDKPFWLRFLYLYPDEIDDEMIALMKSDPRICPYVDMPIQHIADPVLKAMHRTTNRAHIEATIQKLRAEIPDISIRTSLMVGFPGETEAQFEELLQFVQTTPLDHVGIFTFSLEKEAFAARLSDQISEEVKAERLNRLAAVQQEVNGRWNRRWIGRRVSALVEGPHPDSELLLKARHKGQAPDVDSCIILNDFTGKEQIGHLVEVEITDVAGLDLVGRVISEKPCRTLALV